MASGAIHNAVPLGDEHWFRSTTSPIRLHAPKSASLTWPASFKRMLAPAKHEDDPTLFCSSRPYGMVWYGMVWYGMVWYGMVWYGMVWYGMVWYGMVCCCCCCCGTQHVPAGEIARHALPGQGAREQSAGVTLAGRVPTTTEGGGGGSAFCLGGGGGARRCERVPMRPWFPPPPWGEGVRTCAKRRRDGGRDGGTTCPGACGAPVPLAFSRHSPATGEGATSCAEVD